MAAERDRLRNDLASCLRTLDQILAPAMWTERLTVRPVPWDERTVNVARGVVEVARLDEWAAAINAVNDRNPGVSDA